MRSEPPFGEDLDVIQDAARRLALHHIATAREALERADRPMDPMRS